MNRRGFLAVTTGAVAGSVLTACARQAPMDMSGDSPVTDSPATPPLPRPQSPRPSDSGTPFQAPTTPPPPLPATKGAIPVGTGLELEKLRGEVQDLTRRLKGVLTEIPPVSEPGN